jgi:hypothetical protein
VLDTTDAVAGFDWTLADIGERHRRFGAVLKAEAAGLAGQALPTRRKPSPPTAYRAPANQDRPPAGPNRYRNRTGA